MTYIEPLYDGTIKGQIDESDIDRLLQLDDGRYEVDGEYKLDLTFNNWTKDERYRLYINKTNANSGARKLFGIGTVVGYIDLKSGKVVTHSSCTNVGFVLLLRDLLQLDWSYVGGLQVFTEGMEHSYG